MSRAHQRRELRAVRATDRTVSVPGGRTYSVPAAVSDADFWQSIGLVRIELERNDRDGNEWWEAHKYFGGRWQCAGEGPSQAEAIRLMRSWRRYGTLPVR